MGAVLLVNGQFREPEPWTPPVVDPEDPPVSGDLEPGDRILWLGDSTVYGHNSSDGDQVANPPASLLETELGGDFPVDYEGVGLATTADLLAGTGGFSGTLDSILAANSSAKVVIITFGINDSYMLSNAQFKSNLEQIVSKIKAAGKIPVLETPNPVSSNLDTTVMTIKTVCTEQDVFCSDQYDYINGIRMDQSITSMMPDGTHPNQKTYELKAFLTARNIILWFGLDPNIPKLEHLLIRPFRTDSYWNREIPVNDVIFHGPSHPCTAEIRRTSKPALSLPAYGISESAGPIVWAVNVDNYGINTFLANRLTPKKQIRVRDIFGNRFDFYVNVPWPTGTVPAGGTDKHLSIIDTDAGISHDFWYINPVGGGNYEAASYCATRLDGTGWNQFPLALEDPVNNPTGRDPAEALWGIGSSRAVSVSCQGGLISKADADRGIIDHVLALAVPRTYIRRGPRVYPADDTGSWYDGDERSNGPLAYSMLLALPPSYDVEAQGFSPVWKMVAYAAKHYGLRIVDVAGTHTPCIYVANPIAQTFGMLLRNGGPGNSGGQNTHFPKIWQNLCYVEE